MNYKNEEFDPLVALSATEAAKLLHVSRPTVVKYIKTGELPSLLIGRCRRIRRVNLENFLAGKTSYGWQPYQPKNTHDDEPLRLEGMNGEIPF